MDRTQIERGDGRGRKEKKEEKNEEKNRTRPSDVTCTREHGPRRRRFVVFAMELKNWRAARESVLTCVRGTLRADFQNNDANDRTVFERSARIGVN